MKDTGMDQFRRELKSKIKGEVSFDDHSRGIYAPAASIYEIKPVAVVLPRDEEDVIVLMKTASGSRIPILPRGGGTSLGGQAVGSAVIVDFSKYMNRILEVNPEERWVRVEPGIVLDELNAALAPYNLHFAPDPATSSRATIGGIIGNNSSGTKSLVYGIARDHILETRVLIPDGNIFLFRDFSIKEFRENGKERTGREREIIGKLDQIISRNAGEIEKAFPKVMRRVQGYNLDSFLHTDQWNLSGLITGSEGTLGIVLESKLNLEPLPKQKILCPIHFAELSEAIRAVGKILDHKPSAVEILDEDVITLARKNLGIAPLCGFIQGDPKAILIVEFFGETENEVKDKANALAADLRQKKTGYHWPVIYAPAEQAKVWAVRKNGLGLILGMKGERKPTPFIEDAALPIEKLPEYVEQILEFCRKRNVPVAMYAHASVGLIHIRPVLNLKDQADINHMRSIAGFSFGLVKQYGGSISGEHGDGRTRSPFLRAYFGDRIYDSFREIKQLFDPAGILNPGIIIDPEPMDSNLRYGPDYPLTAPATVYHYREDGGFRQAVEMCTGVGACRQNLAGTMCPSFRATRDEEHSTRGRANALRLAMTGQLGEGGLTGKLLYEVFGLCLSCKACKSECPSNVDVARLKSEFLQTYHKANGIRLRERFIAGSTILAGWIAGWKAPIMNFKQKTLLFRKALEWIAGIDSRRALPAYARRPFPGWFAEHARSADPRGKNGKVVLFNDTYMNYHETGIGISAVELLESCGYEVILANAGCCQRPRISHGFLKKAKREGEKTLRNLDEFIRQGLKIVVCEPGCASALTDDLPDLVDDEPLGQRIKAHVMMIDHFLEEEIRTGKCKKKFSSEYQHILLHGHCHQKSLYGTNGMAEILKSIEGIKVEVLDAGCCGMAGSFGYEKEHYDLSMQIGEERLFPAIRNAPAGTVTVACGFSCRHQIRDGTGQKALHWVETLRGES